MDITLINHGHTTDITWIQVEPGQTAEVSRGGRTHEDKGEPIGTAADRLAGTAVDCVICEKSLSSMPQLIGLAADMFES